MIRRAFTMKLKPGAFAEYKKHHDNIWPELVAEIEESGIAQITTFRRGLDLFLFSEIRNASAWNRLWKSPVHTRWAALMEPLMQMTEEGIVDAGPLSEIFHLQTTLSEKKVASTSKKVAAKVPVAKKKASPKKKPVVDRKKKASQ